MFCWDEVLTWKTSPLLQAGSPAGDRGSVDDIVAVEVEAQVEVQVVVQAEVKAEVVAEGLDEVVAEVLVGVDIDTS